MFDDYIPSICKRLFIQCIHRFVLFNYIFRNELLIMLNLREPKAHNKTKSKKKTADPRSASVNNTASVKTSVKIDKKHLN